MEDWTLGWFYAVLNFMIYFQNRSFHLRCKQNVCEQVVILDSVGHVLKNSQLKIVICSSIFLDLLRN